MSYMFKTKSLNKASYISTITGKTATLDEDRRGYNNFCFEYDGDIIKASDEYNKEVSSDGVLMVNMVEYNSYIRHYKDITRQAKNARDRRRELNYV